jgi:RNA polymerase sigma-70 factor, ECF subfamily
MDTTPVTLLEQVRQPGNHAAWERFVRLYTPLLLGFARRRGLQDADAADLVQEVFVALVRALPTFRYDAAGSFRAWLGTFAWNRFRERARRRVPLPTGASHPAWDQLTAAGSTEAFDEAEYRATLLARGLGLARPEFSPSVWALFEATVLNGLTPSAAANKFGVTANSVYLARSRVLRRLKELLAGLLD